MRRPSMPILSFAFIILVLLAISENAFAQLGFITPTPTGNTIHDMWSPDGQTVFLVGDGGMIMKYENGAFSFMTSPTLCPLLGVSGTSASDVWAVGGCRYSDLYDNTDPRSSVILHYDGQAWSSVAPPDYLGTYYAFSGVYAVDGDTAYAAFPYGNYLVRRNAGIWSFYDTGLHDLGMASFQTVNGFGPSDVFAAGTCGDVIRYDGAQWTLKEWEQGCDGSFSTNLLYAIWGPDADNVFVGGNSGQIYHWSKQAQQWDVIREPAFIGGPGTVNAISGTSAADAYFAGRSLWRWDGSQLTEVLTSYGDYEQNAMLRMNDGNYLLGHEWGLVSRFDGTARTDLTSPAGRTENWFFASRTPKRAWLSQRLLNQGDGVYSYDGASYVLHALPSATGQADVMALRAFADNDVMLSLRTVLGLESVVLHFNGSAWSEQAIPQIYNEQIIDFDRLPDGSLAIVTGAVWHDDFYGYRGRACVVNGSTLSCADNNAYDFRRIASDGSGTLYAAGVAGKVASYANGQWTTETTPLSKDLTDIAAHGDTAYAVARDRLAIWKTGGGAWTTVTGVAEKAENAFVAVTHAGNNVFYAVINSGNDSSTSYIGANKGAAYKLENGAASMEVTGLTAELYNASSSGQGDVLFGGSHGVLFGTAIENPRTRCPATMLLLLNTEE